MKPVRNVAGPSVAVDRTRLVVCVSANRIGGTEKELCQVKHLNTQTLIQPGRTLKRKNTGMFGSVSK